MQKLNLKKLCVGSDGIESMILWQKQLCAEQKNIRPDADSPFQHLILPYHDTRNMPRQADSLQGGSLYWIRKKKFFARQKIHLLEARTSDEGKKFCRIWLKPEIIAVEAMRDRIFQGWRYLKVEDSPADKDSGNVSEDTEDMQRELQRLGLL